ncbi:MAG TPA: glycosyltransferase family 9 protein [Actinomycetota bacterium]|nr:glycosyltransferase family 9 protein [Actinomycetota bacterium]
MSGAVLALRALGLGDLLTAVPALRALARAHPARPLLLAAPPALAPVADLVGVVDRLVPARPLGALPAPGRGAWLGVNLHGSGPQSHRVLLDARPGRLLAFRHPDVPETAGAPRWRDEEHEVVRWCRLLEESGIPSDPGDLSLLTPPQLVPAVWRGATVVHPGAASPARRWPAERWAAVAAAERGSGRTVVVTGGAAEVGLARRVAVLAGLGPEAVLAGGTDLGTLAALAAAAGRVLCGDTGMAHLATAFRTPSVVLFGPTPPARWGPPAGGPHVVLWKGRRGDPHAAEPDPGLLAIEVDEVLDAVARLDRDAGRAQATGSTSPSSRTTSSASVR